MLHFKQESSKIFLVITVDLYAIKDCWHECSYFHTNSVTYHLANLYMIVCMYITVL